MLMSGPVLLRLGGLLRRNPRGHGMASLIARVSVVGERENTSNGSHERVAVGSKNYVTRAQSLVGFAAWRKFLFSATSCR